MQLPLTTSLLVPERAPQIETFAWHESGAAKGGAAADIHELSRRFLLTENRTAARQLSTSARKASSFDDDGRARAIAHRTTARGTQQVDRGTWLILRR